MGPTMIEEILRKITIYLMALLTNKGTDCIIKNKKKVHLVSRTPKHIRRPWGRILPKEPVWVEKECDWWMGSTSHPLWWPVPAQTETSCGLRVHQREIKKRQENTFAKLNTELESQS